MYLSWHPKASWQFDWSTYLKDVLVSTPRWKGHVNRDGSKLWTLRFDVSHSRRKFRSQTSDSMDRWKAEMGRVREEKRRRKKIKKEKVSEKEDPGARKGREVAKHCVFLMICGSGGSKSRLAKAAGAEPAGQMRDEKMHAVVARSTFSKSKRTNHTSSRPLLAVEMSKKCTPLWREEHFEVKMHKALCSDHIWKLRCLKSARRCGAKHISKSKCRKHTSSGPLLEVEMSKKCTPLWREAHVEVKSPKTEGYGALLDVQVSFAW